MAKTEKQKKGKQGEDWAAAFLEQKNYEIVERNYRYKHSEIDIIAKKDEILVFVEVKSRENADFGNPEEAVSAAKRAQVHHAARYYLATQKITQEIRFDIIAITGFENPEIEHFEDAF